MQRVRRFERTLQRVWPIAGGPFVSGTRSLPSWLIPYCSLRVNIFSLGDVSVRALFDTSSALEKRSQLSDWTFFGSSVAERIGISGAQFSFQRGATQLNQKSKKLPLDARVDFNFFKYYYSVSQFLGLSTLEPLVADLVNVG